MFHYTFGNSGSSKRNWQSADGKRHSRRRRGRHNRESGDSASIGSSNDNDSSSGMSSPERGATQGGRFQENGQAAEDINLIMTNGIPENQVILALKAHRWMNQPFLVQEGFETFKNLGRVIRF